MSAHTSDDAQMIVQKYWGDLGHLVIRTPNSRRSEKRVRKAFRNAAMRRLFEISTNILDDAAEAEKCAEKTSKLDQFEARIAQLEGHSDSAAEHDKSQE